MTYRRTIHEIPVEELELEEAEIEGVEIMYHGPPTRVIADDNGKVTGLELIRNDLASLTPRVAGARNRSRDPNS